MRHHLICRYIFWVVASIITLMTGCTGRVETKQVQHPQDSIYTQKTAMMVYDYDPVRALQIIDSAVIVGNLSDWRADKNRACIYSRTRLRDRLDSLLHLTTGARLDSARAIGERLLGHDSVKNSYDRQQDVLEILVYTARLQEDTLTWLQRSQHWWRCAVCREPRPRPCAMRPRWVQHSAEWDSGMRAWPCWIA